MVRVELLAWTPPFLPVIAEKTSAGQVARKGLEYYRAWHERHSVEDLCRHLEAAARDYPSVLEHVTFTFYIEGCSRVCTHQLVRHRLASYTQESQRYSILRCIEEDPRLVEDILDTTRHAVERYMDTGSKEELEEAANYVVSKLGKCFEIPESILRLDPGTITEILKGIVLSIRAYQTAILLGVPPEDARYLLPQAVKSRLVMTVNLRELLHILKLRGSGKAQWEIRRLAEEVKRKVGEIIPCIDELVDRYEG